MNKNGIVKKVVIFIICCAVLIFIDQITKSLAVHTLSDGNVNIINNFMYLELVYNSGAAFGILNNWRIVFCILTVIFCIVIEIFYLRLPGKRTYLPLRIIGIVLFSGACGNLIDRIKTGVVVDFIAFDFGSYSFPRFNCADIYVTLSAIALFIMLIFVYNEEQLKEAVRGE